MAQDRWVQDGWPLVSETFHDWRGCEWAGPWRGGRALGPPADPCPQAARRTSSPARPRPRSTRRAPRAWTSTAGAARRARKRSRPRRKRRRMTRRLPPPRPQPRRSTREVGPRSTRGSSLGGTPQHWEGSGMLYRGGVTSAALLPGHCAIGTCIPNQVRRRLPQI